MIINQHKKTNKRINNNKHDREYYLTLGYALRFILSLAALIKGTRLNNGFAIFKNGC